MTVCMKLSGKEACMHVIGVPPLVYAIEVNAITQHAQDIKLYKRLLVSLHKLYP